MDKSPYDLRNSTVEDVDLLARVAQAAYEWACGLTPAEVEALGYDLRRLFRTLVPFLDTEEA